MPDALAFSTLDDGVAIVTLDDPTSGNALGEGMVREVAAAINACGRDARTRAIILRGGPEMFSSGAPRALLDALAQSDLEPHDILLPRVLLGCPVPVVTAMAGHAVGGGFALGLAGDIVLMARESRYGFTFLDLGFTPGMGATRLCEHALSPAIAHELLYTGELRRGALFLGASGINHVLPREEVHARALDIARRIADKPRPALEALKRSLTLPRRRAFEETLTLETLMHQLTFHTPEARGRIARALDDI